MANFEETAISKSIQKHWRKLSTFLTLIILFGTYKTNAQTLVEVERPVVLMGSLFQVTIVAPDSSLANHYIDETIEEIIRIENLISEWQPHTQISMVNRNAGIAPVKVDREVFELTKRAIQYAEMSAGAFDISIAAMDKIWQFDGSMTQLPSAENIQQSVKNVNYKDIVLDSINSTIFLAKQGMKIGFGSIGKGYAADKGRELMLKRGVYAGIVNASGDIAAWGLTESNKPWRIGINNPFKKNKIAKVLQLNNSAVATSGSYEKYAEINGIRYSHIINPKTGYPSQGLTSVTIEGPSAEIANALSTTIMVIGAKKGKELLKNFKDYNYLFITDKGKIIP